MICKFAFDFSSLGVQPGGGGGGGGGVPYEMDGDARRKF